MSITKQFSYQIAITPYNYIIIRPLYNVTPNYDLGIVMIVKLQKGIVVDGRPATFLQDIASVIQPMWWTGHFLESLRSVRVDLQHRW